MSQSIIPQTAEERDAANAKAAADAKANAPKQLDALHTEHGDTTIADTVVAKIAGMAAREVPGVYAMGNAARRAISGITNRVSGGTGQASVSNGVSVEKGESQSTVDVSVVVEYGASIVTVSDQIRENVIRAVEFGTGLEVVSVDVNVTDVHLPDEDDESTDSASSASLR
ncbi:Asp23/Gls24 family envelope stress response protein [Microlunatus antarcticus]|uniref:Putative alkaline shock family protein YloU n=1 Tax=Microlunatus antarcticus TaxID=53388 RepID=A0A7W5JW62_9ACTN|nr:putative alkaline shock family protein YloU [Microlunatus antarcticus]